MSLLDFYKVSFMVHKMFIRWFIRCLFIIDKGLFLKFSLVIFLAVLHSLWDLSSPTRDQTGVPAMRVPSPNVRTTAEFPLSVLFQETAESEL